MIALPAIAALSAALATTAPPADTFPHTAHRRLFTSCRSCHAGIVSGDSARARPRAADCAACHDGQIEPAVDWVPREAGPSNLRFDHRAHFAAAPDSTANATSCRGCHAQAGATAFMDVARARPEGCLGCHAHQAEQHLAASNRCATCHVPLTEATRIAEATVARFPKPPTHDSGYVFRHADAAARGNTCQVCHSRESCATCHVNAGRLAPVQQLGSDARVAHLVRDRSVTYRAPASHATGDFIRSHGLQARRGVGSCGNCHARESCLVCHSQTPLVPVVNALPRRLPGGAPGVDLAAKSPPGHVPGFRTSHGAQAAGGDASCARCHRQSFCSACHDAARRPAFHQANFVIRHASAALQPASECSNCHQVLTFCRDCHRQTGTAQAARPSLNSGRFHNALPAWSFSHGAAARRSLESCASCHQQNFCLPCHSASRGWRINPHGPGFSPSMGDRNAAMCRICHTPGPPPR